MPQLAQQVTVQLHFATKKLKCVLYCGYNEGMMLQEFFKKNAWNILVFVVGMIVLWSNLNNRVEALAKDVEDNTKSISEYSALVERVVKLEENRQVVTGDIGEIKDDIKDIKKHFEIK